MTHRTRSLAFGLVGFVIGAVLIPLAVAHADVIAPTVRVKPSRHLADQQVVPVTWKGFSAGPNQQDHDVVVAECSGAVTMINQAECGAPIMLPALAHGKTDLTVTTGPVGSGPGYTGGTCGTSKHDTKTCVVVVEMWDHVHAGPLQVVSTSVWFTKP